MSDEYDKTGRYKLSERLRGVPATYDVDGEM